MSRGKSSRARERERGQASRREEERREKQERREKRSEGAAAASLWRLFFFPCFPSLLPRLPLFSTTAIALVLPRAQTISPSLCSQRLRKEGKRRTRQRERGEDARSISHLMKKKPLASQPLNSDTALPPRPTHRSDPSSPARRASSSADRLDWRATRSAAAMVKTGVL